MLMVPAHALTVFTFLATDGMTIPQQRDPPLDALAGLSANGMMRRAKDRAARCNQRNLLAEMHNVPPFELARMIPVTRLHSSDRTSFIQ